ncbi:MAG: hypothetical protein IT360_27285 [Gemmatimonadaceae bacterium]|nr:hypothetical protein [Gemmatimonadaceae bacterium]
MRAAAERVPWRRVGALGVVAVLAMGASYGATRAVQARRPTVPVDSASAAAAARQQYPSGEHLVAYVVLSHRCGFCAEPETRAALRVLRDSLRAHAGAGVVRVQVVGVAIDDDLDAGWAYLRAMNGRTRAFDALSVGGDWLNDVVVQLVWRGGVVEAATPTVVVVTRRVDASAYPDHVDVQADQVVLRVVGRDSLLAWVAAGAPVGVRTAAVTPAGGRAWPDAGRVSGGVP